MFWFGVFVWGLIGVSRITAGGLLILLVVIVFVPVTYSQAIMVVYGNFSLVNEYNPMKSYYVILNPDYGNHVLVKNSSIDSLEVAIRGFHPPSNVTIEIIGSHLDILTITASNSSIETIHVLVLDSSLRAVSGGSGVMVLNGSHVSIGIIAPSNFQAYNSIVDNMTLVSPLKVEFYSTRIGGVYIVGNIHNESSIVFTNTSFNCSRRSSFYIDGYSLTNLYINDSNLSCQFNGSIIQIKDALSLVVSNSLIGGRNALIYASLDGNSTFLRVWNSTLIGSVFLYDRGVGGYNASLINARIGGYWPNASREHENLPIVSIESSKPVALSHIEIFAKIVNVNGNNIIVRNSFLRGGVYGFHAENNAIIDRSRLVMDEFYLDLRGYGEVDRSLIASTLAVSLRGTNSTFKILDSRVTGGASTLSFYLSNSTLDLNISSTIFESPKTRIVITGYPPPLPHVNVRVRDSYLGSPLGPEVYVNGTRVRDGGTSISIVACKGNINIISWLDRPNGNVYLPLLMNTTIKIGPGRFVPALDSHGRALFLVDTGRPSDRIWVYSNSSLQVMVRDGFSFNASLETGNHTLTLPGQARFLKIYITNIYKINRTTVTQPTSSTTWFESNTTRTGGGALKPKNITAMVLIILLVVLAIVYFSYQHRKIPK